MALVAPKSIPVPSMALQSMNAVTAKGWPAKSLTRRGETVVPGRGPSECYTWTNNCVWAWDLMGCGEPPSRVPVLLAAAMYDATRLWTAATGVNFMRATGGDHHFVLNCLGSHQPSVPDAFASAFMPGDNSYKNTITISMDRFQRLGRGKASTILLHELGHVLGLWHCDANRDSTYWRNYSYRYCTHSIMNSQLAGQLEDDALMTVLSPDDVAGIRDMYTSDSLTFENFGGQTTLARKAFDMPYWNSY
ncbi:hypothetical protein BJ741DRAFT_613531 [Chytriomyces cf. hyalinus JEL632]|nr:hypothetical protein BJ741DRAFT_613531 [Chytriomyces cf. hyalinus JEL632]